jgi:hypothetical protein
MGETVKNSTPEGATGIGIDWLRLANRLQVEITNLIHGENQPQLSGDAFYAEALRRALMFSSNDVEGQRQLPYGTVRFPGLTTQDEADYLRDSHTIIDRLNAERAREKVAAMRIELKRVYRDAARDLAKYVRDGCNERTVTAKLRREGVMLAADWIDPDNPVRHPFSPR